MRRITGLILLMVVSFPMTSGQAESTQSASRHASKIREHEVSLADFANGKETVRVIVKLASPDELLQNDRKNTFKDLKLRKNFAARIREIQTRVINPLNLQQIHIKKRFS